MNICPKCNITHYKNGLFCSRSCANSRGPRSQEVKELISKKMSGKILSQERKDKTSGSNNGSWKGGITKIIICCKFCEEKYETNNKKTKFCSQDCWKKYCKSNKSDREIYKQKCQFKFNIYEFSEYFDLHLIEKYGWYSAANRGNNQTGVQRDHMYSISDGFENNIDPILLAHPVNCELVFNFSNQRKQSTSSLSIEELKQRINDFDIEFQYVY